MGERMGACCGEGCGYAGPYKQAVEHVTGCVKYAERCRDEPEYEGFDPAVEWERRQREQDDGEAEPVMTAVATRAEDIPDAKVVVLDKRGEAQRESDEIRAGFGVWHRIAGFVRKERYRELGYSSAAAWWAGERIGACSESAEVDRKDLVRALTGAGLSVRATGAMLAISPAQAQRDKTGKDDHKSGTRQGRKAVEVSRHARETAGQAANGGGTPGAVTAVQDLFAFLDDEAVSAGAEGRDEYECVCAACGHKHARKGEK